MSTPKTRTKNSNGLTWLQQAFVQAYVGAAQGNATEAARIAGYAAPSDNALAVAGKRNLANANIRSEIERKKAIIQANTGIDVEWFTEQCRSQYIRLADEDRATACRYLDMLGRSIGAYDRPEGSRTGTAPTIVINMPDRAQDQAQPRLVDSVVVERDQGQDSA